MACVNETGLLDTGSTNTLKDIQDYLINQHVPKAEKKVIVTLLSRTRQLEEVPLSGHKMSDYPDDEIRELFEEPYRIIYRVTEQQIEILTVMHYRQLLPTTVNALRSRRKNA